MIEGIICLQLSLLLIGVLISAHRVSSEIRNGLGEIAKAIREKGHNS